MRTRKNEIKIRLDDKELERLNAMVAKTTSSREGFIREMLADYQLVEAPNEDLSGLMCQITALVSDINILFSDIKLRGFVARDQILKANEGLWAARDMLYALFLPYHKKRGTMLEEYADE